MNVQIITGNDGLSSGVFIAMKDWQTLKGKNQIKESEGIISEAQLLELEERLEAYIRNPDSGKDWETLKNKYPL